MFFRRSTLTCLKRTGESDIDACMQLKIGFQVSATVPGPSLKAQVHSSFLSLFVLSAPPNFALLPLSLLRLKVEDVFLLFACLRLHVLVYLCLYGGLSGGSLHAYARVQRCRYSRPPRCSAECLRVSVRVREGGTRSLCIPSSCIQDVHVKKHGPSTCLLVCVFTQWTS